MNEKLSERQQIAVAALLDGSTRVEAARKAKVSKATMFRWLGTPEFQAALKQGREQLFEAFLSELYGLDNLATQTLKRLMKSGNLPVEARAAIAVKTLLLRAKDLDVLNRIEQLEKQLAEQKKL